MAVPIIFKNKYLTPIFTVSAIVWVIVFSLAYVGILDNQNLLVIHFDSYKGADFFGNRGDVADILITAAIIWLINLFLANEFYFKERFLSYVLASGTLVFMVLILLAVNVIINVN